MDIAQIIAKIKAGPNDITLYSAATEQLIEALEAKAGLVLPHDFKCLYLFSNGFISDEDLFRLIPLEELIDDWYNDDWYNKGRIPGEFYFSEYLIYSDLWGVKCSTDGRPVYSIFYPASESRQLFMTNSLAEFLGRFLTAGVYGKDGLYDWSNDSLPTLKP